MDRGKGVSKEWEVNMRREVCEGEGCVLDREVIGASSMLMLIHRTVTLTRMLSTLDLIWE